MFLLPLSIFPENLHSTGISRFNVRPLRLTGFRHSHTRHLQSSVYIGLHTRVLPLRLIPQELRMTRLVVFPSLSDSMPSSTPGWRCALIINARIPWPASKSKESANHPKYTAPSRSYVSDSELHPSPRRTHYLSCLPFGRSVNSLPDG